MGIIIKEFNEYILQFPADAKMPDLFAYPFIPNENEELKFLHVTVRF